MKAIANGIDHPVIGVRDMPAARRSYESLGFSVPPRGVHPAWGTGNWCIMFANDYLELRGVVDPARGMQKMQSFFDKFGEGLMGVALGTTDVEASFDAAVNRGCHPQPVRQLARDFELPDGLVAPRFGLCFLEHAETPGLMSVVLCQHLTPELLRRPEWLQHRNGAQGVQSMTGLVADLQAAEAAHVKLFGEENVERDDQLLTIKVGLTHVIRLTTPRGLTTAYPALDLTPHEPVPRLVAVTLQTGDLGKTSDYFQGSSCVAAKLDDAIVIRPEAACGVVLEFRE